MDHDHHDHPDARLDLVALGVHAAGWTSLLVTGLILRAAVGPASWRTALLVVGGLSLFAGLVAWSAVRIVMQHLGAERRAVIEQQCGIATPHLVVVPRAQRTSAIGGCWGRTTIVAHGSAVGDPGEAPHTEAA